MVLTFARTFRRRADLRGAIEPRGFVRFTIHRSDLTASPERPVPGDVSPVTREWRGRTGQITTYRRQRLSRMRDSVRAPHSTVRSTSHRSSSNQ